MDMDLHLQLPKEPRAPMAARHVIDGLVDLVSRDVIERFRIVISELVTNSVRHASGSSRPIRLVAHVDSHVIRAEVIDGGEGIRPTPQPPRAGRQSGWGLFLVSELADRWGVDRGPSSAVWCEFDIPDMAGAVSRPEPP